MKATRHMALTRPGISTSQHNAKQALTQRWQERMYDCMQVSATGMDISYKPVEFSPKVKTL